MEQDVYFQLGERLNQYQVKLLLVEPFLKILREIYTEEEARLGAAFPMGAHTASQLAQVLGREEKTLTELLERMADKGTVFVTRGEDGQKRYALTAFVPGASSFSSCGVRIRRGTAGLPRCSRSSWKGTWPSWPGPRSRIPRWPDSSFPCRPQGPSRSKRICHRMCRSYL